MQISAINKFSLIEFPGQISSVIFTPGCNFRCDYCHNSEFVLPDKLKNIYKNLILEKAFFNFLEKRRGFLTGVSICGGEPTLQNDLKIFCRKVKDLGFLVKLDTNGRDSKIISELINENLVDYVAMDIKHEIGKFSISAGVELDESMYLETINILMNSKIDYEFRTTVIKGFHSKENIKNISKYISGAKAYYLQNYRSGNTLNVNFNGKSFSDFELNELKELSLKYIKNVGIRN